MIAGDGSNTLLFSVSSVTTFSLMKFSIDGVAENLRNATKRQTAKNALNIFVNVLSNLGALSNNFRTIHKKDPVYT